MKTYPENNGLHLMVAVLLLQLFTLNLFAQKNDVTIKIHLRGVYESKITLMSQGGGRTYKPIADAPGIKNGQTATLIIPKAYLPGEIVIRFDYMEDVSSTPYPSEKSIFAYNQNLELWVRPQYCNNPDSTWFQKGEMENSTFSRFSLDNSKKKEKIGLLQNFLMNYDETESEFYKMGVAEYEKRRDDYNNWLTKKLVADSSLFVSTMYPFQYIQQISWKGNETDRILNMIEHYFDGQDFKNPFLIKTSLINKWMDNYVNLYGQLATTTALRDSLFPLAGKSAIEKAKKGDPLVYGWMVDYFYRGYESNAIDAGMKILEPYMNDPACLTSKKLEISRRLEGMKTLVPGSIAPEIVMQDMDDHEFSLSAYNTGTKYLLLIFWSANCEHCLETTGQLYPWQQQPEIAKKLAVVAISLDETEPELAAWEKKWVDYREWKHLRAPEGIRSEAASDYYVLATPVMVLMDAQTKKIIALPNTFTELKEAMK